MLFNKNGIPSIRDIEDAWNTKIAPKFSEMGFKFEKSWITVRIQHTSISALSIALCKRVRYSKALMRELVTIIEWEVRYIEEEFEYISKHGIKVTEKDILKFISKLGYLYTVIGSKDTLELKKKLSEARKETSSDIINRLSKNSSNEDDEF
jgi:hypothetical protein